jgi:HEAT repeat protein
MQKKTSILTRLFNITKPEWPRVMIALLMKIFIQMTYIMGWTLIVSVFVIKVSVKDLPFLFILNAFLIIGGSALYSFVVHKYKKEKLLIFTGILAIIFFLLSRLFFESNLLLFLFVFLIAESALISQLNILIVLFMEEIFTPLEAQRTVPFIESAEPIGGILGGVLITLLATYFAVADLVYFLVPFLVLFVFFVWYFGVTFEIIPRLKTKEEHEENHNLKKLGRIRAGIIHLKGVPFLKTLLIIVLCQWFFFTLVEFQYTKYVHDAVTHEATIVESGHEEVELAEEPEKKVVPLLADEELHHQQMGNETALTQGLGMLHIMFSILVLLSRIFLHSRIFVRIGLVKSSLLYPIGSILSGIIMLIFPGFYAAVFLKAETEVTGAIHTDAYHNSYYGLKEVVADQTKEFMEGVVRPLGLIVGTISLFILQFIFTEEKFLIQTINILALFIMVAMFYTIYYKHQTNYTNVSKRNLDRMGDHPIKFTALEVLSQPGHANSAELLIKNLIYKKESIVLKKKILEVLGNLQDLSTIPEIIKAFDDASDEVKLVAVQSLSHFTKLNEHLKTKAFSKYRVIEALKLLFLKTQSKKVKSEVINVFTNINHHEVIPFLLEVLAQADDELKADCIYVCGLFNDISVAHYIEKYLDSDNPEVKANTIVALWSFVRYRLKLLVQLVSLIESDEKENILAGIHVLGETSSIQEIPRLIKLLNSEDIEIRQYAAIALAKMNYAESVEHLMELILHRDKEIAFTTNEMLRRVHPNINLHVSRRLKQEVSQRINEILKEVDTNVLEDLEEGILTKLRDEYQLLRDEKEVIKIDKILMELRKR